MNIRIFAIIIPILLCGCEVKSGEDLMQSIQKSSVQFIESVVSYNYKGLFNSFVMAYKTSRRDRYSEYQTITILTQRDGQNGAYNGIIAECEVMGCKVVKSDYVKNNIFPENISAKLTIEIPSSQATSFVGGLNKFGKLSNNTFKNDKYVQTDLRYYESELENLKLIKSKLSENINRPDVFNPSVLVKLADDSMEINKKIMYIEDDIKYLNSLNNMRTIDIVVGREYNSMANKVKASIQNGFDVIANFIHIFFILVFIFTLWYIFKFVKYFLSTLGSLIIGMGKSKKSNVKFDVKSLPKEEEKKEPGLNKYF